MAVIKSGNSTSELIVNSNGAARIVQVTANGQEVDFSTLFNTVSSNNSSIAILTSGSTFTGTADDVYRYNSAVTSVKTDRDGILYMEFSMDGQNWDSSLDFNIVAGINEVHRLTITKRYFRCRFTNTSGSNQSYFRLQTLYGGQQAITSALNSSVQQDADATTSRTIDSELTIAAGLFSGYSIVNKFGYNPDVDTATVPEDIWEGGGVYTGFPVTSGETITVVSTSVNDTAAGTGARTIRISGLDANYNEQTEDFTLNGLTNVDGIKTFTRVHTMTVLTSGSSNTAFNAGTISAFHTVTTANVFINMRVGVNQSNCSAYTIPAGYTGYLRHIHSALNAGSASTSAVDLSIWTQSALKTNSPRLRRPNTVYFGVEMSDNIYGGISFSEKTDLMLRATTCTQNNTGVSAGYDLLLVKN